MSGDALAKLVGYKNQSAIGNLENRPGASGGNKISAIATALGVTTDWLLNGPDTDNVPLLNSYSSHDQARHSLNEEPAKYESEQILDLYRRLDAAGKREAVDFLTFLVQKQDKSAQTHRKSDPVPGKKAA